MKFYTKQHKFYCGIDLHTKKMYICILYAAGEIRFHQNIQTEREVFLKVIEPFREDIAVAAECMHGTGSRISVLKKEFLSSWDMRFI